MPYLIDGKNLVGALGWDPSSDEDEARMCRMVLGWASTRRARFTIVLDGPPRPGLPSGGSVTLRFCPGRSADDAILDVIRSSAAPSNQIVVTNDRRLRHAARRADAQVIACSELLQIMRPRRPRPRIRSRREEAARRGVRSLDPDKPSTWDVEADLQMFTQRLPSSRK